MATSPPDTELEKKSRLTWRDHSVLAVLGVGLAILVSRFQPFPGYLDSDYYYGGGIQLATGAGFSEPYLWNYLDDPQQLPHPSHSYWMPLASLISAGGMWITNSTTYDSARLGFLLLAGAVPIATARLAWAFSRRRLPAMISGLLAVFSVYYAPFLPVSDNYGVYIVLGCLFLLAVGERRLRSFFGMGLLAGAMTMARSDGLLWLAMAAVAASFPAVGAKIPGADGLPDRTFSGRATVFGTRSALALLGFLLVMGPWFLRNLSVYGTLMAPGGERLLWLTTYNDTFAYPAAELTVARWLDQGWSAILAARLSALRWNLLNAFAAQGEIFLVPFIIVAAWLRRRDATLKVGALAWLCILAAMSAVFPFAGARGGFFHAGASVQGLGWALAPLGLEAVVELARMRGMFTPHAFRIFGFALVGIAALMTGVILRLRVLPGWGEGEANYPSVEAFIQEQGAAPGDAVMVRNPAGYYIMTGRPAIVTPYAAVDSIAAAASRFGAGYLVLEPSGAVGPIKSVYDGSGGSYFEFLGDLDGIRVFRVHQ